MKKIVCLTNVNAKRIRTIDLLPFSEFRFFPDEIIRTCNNVEEGMDLTKNDKHFLLKPCGGGNHYGINCFATVRIRSLEKCKTSSVKQVRIIFSPIK